MAILQVLTVPDPRLRQKAKPVDKVDDNIRRLMDDLMETMYTEDGGGLAATQVGIPLRVIVMDLSYGIPGFKPIKMANPEIVWKSDELKVEDEACISVPDQYAKVVRSKAVRVRYLDENNKQHEIEVEDLFAKCVQHEIDHLDGRLYIDYLPPIKKDLLIRKAQRVKRNYL